MHTLLQSNMIEELYSRVCTLRPPHSYAASLRFLDPTFQTQRSHLACEQLETSKCPYILPVRSQLCVVGYHDPLITRTHLRCVPLFTAALPARFILPRYDVGFQVPEPPVPTLAPESEVQRSTPAPASARSFGRQ